MRRIFFVLLALASTLLVMCVAGYLFTSGGMFSPERRCAKETAAWGAELKPYLNEWNDLVVLADSTSRMNLSPLIRDMQTVRREAMTLEAPHCAASARAHLDLSMDLMATAFTAFMAQESDAVVTAAMKVAADELLAFNREVETLTDVPPSKLQELAGETIFELIALIPKSELPRETYINGYDANGQKMAEVYIWSKDGTVLTTLQHGAPVTITKIDGPNCFVTTEAGAKGIVDCFYTQ
jgi:hypothetical protein